MQNRLMQAVVGLGFALCLSTYAIAQTTLPPEPTPPTTVAGAYQVKATLSGAQEVMEPTDSSSSLTGGEATIEFDAGLTQAQVTLNLEGDPTAATAVNLHCGRAGVDGPVAVALSTPGSCDTSQLATGMLTCTLTNADFAEPADCEGTIDRPINNIASLFFAARDGLVYANVQTAANTSGEIRGQLIESESTDGVNPSTAPPQ
jgi:hypothetical protein